MIAVTSQPRYQKMIRVAKTDLTNEKDKTSCHPKLHTTLVFGTKSTVVPSILGLGDVISFTSIIYL